MLVGAKLLLKYPSQSHAELVSATHMQVRAGLGIYHANCAFNSLNHDLWGFEDDHDAHQSGNPLIKPITVQIIWALPVARAIAHKALGQPALRPC